MKDKIIDISRPLTSDLPVWPGAKSFQLKGTKSFAENKVNESAIEMNIHTGTHIDAPFHFNPKGERVRDLSLNVFLGRALIIDATGRAEIDEAFVSTLNLSACERVIFKTDNSDQKNNCFNKNFVALTSEAAKLLASCGVSLVGVDGPSIQLFKDKTSETHEVLLDDGIVILEGLNLRHVVKGWYELIAFPLNIPNAEGAPTRAVLRGLDR